MKNCVLLCVLIGLLIFGSCKDDPIGPDPVNIDIADEFKVLLWESLNNGERSFHLNLETIAANSCENAEIEYTQINQSSGIFLTVHDIINDHCTFGAFPAKADVAVGTLSPTSYPIDINLKNVIPNIGNLIVTNNYYEVTIDELNGIIIPNKRLYKVPENSIWGYVAYEDASGEIPHDNFINELSSITNPLTPISGYYGYFQIEENASIQLVDNLPQQYVTPFLFKYNGTSNQLEDLRANYNNINFPGVEFKIYTSKGKEF